MRFFLDENFPRGGVGWLHSLGHEAIHALEHLPQGSPDAKLLEEARRLQAVLLTTDKDFFHTVSVGVDAHCGVVVIALKQPNRTRLLQRLELLLPLLSREVMTNTVWLATDQNLWSRKRP